MSGIEAWRGILEEGERIIWQGGPERSDRPVGKPLAFGILATVLALLVLYGGAWAGIRFGLLFVVAGSWMLAMFVLVVLPLYRARVEHRDRFYTLTDQRAIVGLSGSHGLGIASYPLSAGTPYKVVRGAGTSIYFDTSLRKTGRGLVEKPVGFERLGMADAQKVLALLDTIVSPEDNRTSAPGRYEDLT